MKLVMVHHAYQVDYVLFYVSSDRNFLEILRPPPRVYDFDSLYLPSWLSAQIA